jgi:hypothetical protein
VLAGEAPLRFAMPDEKDLLVVSIDILGCQQITSWFEFVSCALEATA